MSSEWSRVNRRFPASDRLDLPIVRSHLSLLPPLTSLTAASLSPDPLQMNSASDGSPSTLLSPRRPSPLRPANAFSRSPSIVASSEAGEREEAMAYELKGAYWDRIHVFDASPRHENVLVKQEEPAEVRPRPSTSPSGLETNTTPADGRGGSSNVTKFTTFPLPSSPTQFSATVLTAANSLDASFSLPALAHHTTFPSTRPA